MEHSNFKLETVQSASAFAPLQLALRGDICDLAEILLNLRSIQAFDRGAARYPVQRMVRCAIRQPVEEVLDGRVTLQNTREHLLELAGENLLREHMFTIDWYFHSGSLGLTNATFDELADPAPLDEAYPTLGEPVESFISRYLDSRETVLILQGAPGTGKTRLVRAILAAISSRKEDSAKVLYTSDKRALESDELFVEFITGSHEAFGIEDADHLLTARSNGNVDLHRFLAIADGVVRAQGRKIIFTTNLPNIGDIDDALVRPGRCHAVVRTRSLTPVEALALLAKLTAADATHHALVSRLQQHDAHDLTLASLYRQLEI